MSVEVDIAAAPPEVRELATQVEGFVIDHMLSHARAVLGGTLEERWIVTVEERSIWDADQTLKVTIERFTL